MADPQHVVIKHPGTLPRIVTFDSVGNVVIETYLDLFPGLFQPVRVERVVIPVEIRAAVAEAIQLPTDD